MEMLEIYKSVCIGWMYQKHINYEMNETDSSQTKLSLAKLQANEWMTKNTNNNGLSPSLSSIMWPNWRHLSYLSWCVSLVHFLSPLHISLLTPSLSLLGKRMCHHRIIYRHWMANDIKLWIDAKRVSEREGTRCEEHRELNAYWVEQCICSTHIGTCIHTKVFTLQVIFPFQNAIAVTSSAASVTVVVGVISMCKSFHFTSFCSIFFDMI